VGKISVRVSGPGAFAVGSKDFVESTKLRLGIHAQGRKVSETESAYQLREPQASYSDDFAPEKEALKWSKIPIFGTFIQIYQGNSLARPRDSKEKSHGIAA